eukprot:5465884-Pyramimonas_sp.AAC.1
MSEGAIDVDDEGFTTVPSNALERMAKAMEENAESNRTMKANISEMVSAQQRAMSEIAKISIVEAKVISIEN